MIQLNTKYLELPPYEWDIDQTNMKYQAVASCVRAWFRGYGHIFPRIARGGDPLRCKKCGYVPQLPSKKFLTNMKSGHVNPVAFRKALLDTATRCGKIRCDYNVVKDVHDS